MFVSGLGYIIGETFKGLYRNRWMCITSTGVVVVTLLMLGLFMLVSFNIGHITETVKEQVEIVVYIDEGADQDTVNALYRKLNEHSQVGEVTYVSSEEHMRRLQMQLGGMLEGYDSALDNPLLASYEIKTVVQLMSGYPYENEQDMEITIKSLDLLKPDCLRIYPFVPICDTEIHDDMERNLVKMNSVDEIIEKSAKIFIRAMENNIPVIRIGLPLSGDIPDIYPHNLSQVVVQKAIEILAGKGEKEFVIPEEWITSFNMAHKKFPEITRGVL